MLQKSSARKGFCTEKSLAINRSSSLGEIRRLENLDRKVTYNACESSYVISTSAWVIFFVIFFFVPKVVPKKTPLLA
jgi:hypothetical protein